MTGLTFARQILELTPEEVGKKVEVTRPMISAWENGSKVIPEKRIDKLAKKLCIRPEFLQKELTPVDQIQILLEMNQYEYQNIVEENTNNLIININDRNHNDFRQNQQMLYKIEVYKLLRNISESFIEQPNSDVNCEESCNERNLKFLNNIYYAIKKGGWFMDKVSQSIDCEKDNIEYNE